MYFTFNSFFPDPILGLSHLKLRLLLYFCIRVLLQKIELDQNFEKWSMNIYNRNMLMCTYVYLSIYLSIYISIIYIYVYIYNICIYVFACVCLYAAKSLQSCPTVRPHRRQPTRLRRPWDSPGKNTGVGCHFLLHTCIFYN